MASGGLGQWSHVHQRRPMSAIIGRCWPMSTDVGRCRLMSAIIGRCRPRCRASGPASVLAGAMSEPMWKPNWHTPGPMSVMSNPMSGPMGKFCGNHIGPDISHVTCDVGSDVQICLKHRCRHRFIAWRHRSQPVPIQCVPMCTSVWPMLLVKPIFKDHCRPRGSP